ncbi:MAG: hypothetical protein MK213_01365 [Planctomycetes bacterium]|nr:hypothetical protein [Planctomycetota bacterium]
MLPDSTPRPKKTIGRRKGPWSQAEIERLKRLYGLRSDAQIGRELNRSIESVRRMARRVFAGEPRTGPWSAHEVQALKSYLGAATLEVISQILRRTPEEIRRKVEEMQNQAHSGPWTSDDIMVLKRLYGTRSNSDLMLILGRPEADLIEKATELCLAKDKGFRRRTIRRGATRMPRWQPEEIEVLKTIYPSQSNLEIAREIGRSVKSIVSKAHDLGLKKSDDRLRDMGRQNVSLRYGRDNEASS